MSMIQLIGTKKCNETRKAERYFKERGLKFHFVDLKERPLSKGELKSISNVVPMAQLIDKEGKEYERLNLKYILHDVAEKLLEYPLLLRTPVVRYGSKVTVGYQPDTWKTWQ